MRLLCWDVRRRYPSDGKPIADQIQLSRSAAHTFISKSSITASNECYSVGVCSPEKIVKVDLASLQNK